MMQSKSYIGMVLLMANLGCVDVGGSHCGKRVYPYFASGDRVATISSGIPKLVIGMSQAEVLAVIGSPDEVNTTFDSIHSKIAKKVGYSFVYIIQRKNDSGSVLEKDEKLLRIQFGLDDKIKQIIPVGIP